MKTYVIQLDSHDDMLTARDKIAWCRAPRVLLVLPERGRSFRSRVELQILQRYSLDHGAQLGLVTKRAEIQDHARDLGIPVFDTVKTARLSSWRRRKKTIRKPDTGRMSLAELRATVHANRGLSTWNGLRLPAFVVGLLAVIALALFFLPGAKIRMQMAEHQQSLQLSVWANPNIPAPNLSGGVPAHEIVNVVEQNGEISSSGALPIADSPARGAILLTNLTDHEVTVPEGTIVVTLSDPPVRFRTLSVASLSTGKDNSAPVNIEAVMPGASGNVAAGVIAAMEGMVGLQVKIENPEPTTGGSDRQSPAPTERDYLRLKESLLKNARQAALEKMEKELASDQVVLPASLEIGKVIEEQFEPAIGQPGDRLRLLLKMEVKGWYVSRKDVESVVWSAMDASLEPGFEGRPDSLAITPVGEPESQGSNVRWEVLAVRQVRSGWSQERLLSAVLGKTTSEATENLETAFRTQVKPQVETWPSWWPRLPFLPFRIQVEVS